MDTIKISKFLSLILRHKPEEIGLVLDENGWADVSELISKCIIHGIEINLDILKDIVANNDKKRFAFNNESCTKIRASQGHSIDIDLDYKPSVPPSFLYHGTSVKFVSSILKTGVEKKSRQFVHLSKDFVTAIKVGQRHGKPAVLKIDTSQMQDDGILFYLSDNGVWLTDYVDPKYINKII